MQIPQCREFKVFVAHYDSSNNVNYAVWCLQKSRPRYCWQNRICYCKKSLNVKVLFFLIKVWNMKNVSISFQQKPIPQLSMFCLIEGITNYVQINTYWSYIVRICIFINLASNILLLVSKKCFLTSQRLVGAGMNCRALSIYSNDSFHFWHFHNRVTCLSFDPIL